MFHSFEGQNANEIWVQLVSAFRSDADTKSQSSRAGDTREILHAGIALSDPRQRWTSVRQPPLNIAFAFAEVVWIVTGRNDAAFLNYFNRKLPLFCGATSTYPGAYGYRLRRHFGFDQLEKAYDVLRNNPDSRQAVLQLWDAKEDLPHHDGSARSNDIPCNVLSLLKVREGRLEWTQIMRSNDIFRGLPYNLIQFTCLQEIIAGWLNLELGAYHHLSDSLHVYNVDWEHIVETPLVQSEELHRFNPDVLSLEKSECEAVFAQMAACLDRIVSERIPTEKLPNLLCSYDFPRAYLNMMCIAAAESARRRQEKEVMDELVRGCKNPLYTEMFRRWVERVA